jgi:hypothetical protein
LPSKKLKLEAFSEIEIISREHLGISPTELLEYFDEEDDMVFYSTLFQFSSTNSPASPQSIADTEQAGTALLHPEVFDLDNNNITSHSQYLVEGKDMDEFEDTFFLLHE